MQVVLKCGCYKCNVVSLLAENLGNFTKILTLWKYIIDCSMTIAKSSVRILPFIPQSSFCFRLGKYKTGTSEVGHSSHGCIVGRLTLKMTHV